MSFYRDVVGLPLLHLAESGVDDFGCAIFGLPGTSTTFELVPASERVPIDHHDLFVLYLQGKSARDVVARRITEAGHEPVDQYQYWELNGAVTFLDPDGRELVLAPWVLGQEPPPLKDLGRGMRLGRGKNVARLSRGDVCGIPNVKRAVANHDRQHVARFGEGTAVVEAPPLTPICT